MRLDSLVAGFAHEYLLRPDRLDHRGEAPRVIHFGVVHNDIVDLLRFDDLAHAAQ